MSQTDALDFERDGALRLAAALDAGALRAIEAALEGVPASRAGVRLAGRPGLARQLSGDAPLGRVAAGLIGPAAFPVRAILFDKSAVVNWALGWHQDRTIAVAARVELPGFGAWTMKQGLLHVAPPFSVLAGMVTLRLHLDPVPADNAPLLAARGSHRLGIVPEDQVESVAAAAGRLVCLAERGDVWAYATPILHASARAVRPARRRVLQVDYAAAPLPGGLVWAGL